MLIKDQEKPLILKKNHSHQASAAAPSDIANLVVYRNIRAVNGTMNDYQMDRNLETFNKKINENSTNSHNISAGQEIKQLNVYQLAKLEQYLQSHSVNTENAFANMQQNFSQRKANNIAQQLSASGSLQNQGQQTPFENKSYYQTTEISLKPSSIKENQQSNNSLKGPTISKAQFLHMKLHSRNNSYQQLQSSNWNASSTFDKTQSSNSKTDNQGNLLPPLNTKLSHLLVGSPSPTGQARKDKFVPQVSTSHQRNCTQQYSLIEDKVQNNSSISNLQQSPSKRGGTTTQLKTEYLYLNNLSAQSNIEIPIFRLSKGDETSTSSNIATNQDQSQDTLKNKTSTFLKLRLAKEQQIQEKLTLKLSNLTSSKDSKLITLISTQKSSANTPSTTTNNQQGRLFSKILNRMSKQKNNRYQRYDQGIDEEEESSTARKSQE